MRVPLSWLRQHVDLPAAEGPHAVASRLTRAGLNVETVEDLAAGITGPLLVGQVLAFDEEAHSNGKTIRWCHVDVGESEPRGIVCGARNFVGGDRVVVSLPGAVLPGGRAISARRTYGHVSDGMIASARELGTGDDATGILVLPPDVSVGADALDVLGLRDHVFEIAVTPDRGYALSVRGVAREASIAYGVELRDPADLPVPAAAGEGYAVRIEDPAGCDRFVARSVTGFDPAAPTPLWLVRRLHMAGMRSISLAVDVTNYVMLELGQPLHGYDAAKLQGPIVVRRARPGERLQTLDGSRRDLDPEDLLITDDSGPIGLAGVMGGASTEISATTTAVLVEAAHFHPVTVTRSTRRHKLPSEASRRFERGVDRAVAAAAAQRAVDLLCALGGARAEPGGTDVGTAPASVTIELDAGHPTRLAGREVAADAVVRQLRAVGCDVSGPGRALLVRPPTWRPDLTDPADLVEEVLRLEGYDTLPSTLPVAPAGRGLTEDQRRRRRVGRALAAAGYVEAPSYPFLSADVFDALGLPPEDARRAALRVANPLSDAEPLLRTTLLPGLLRTLARNVGRGFPDVALFEEGLVFRPRPAAPMPPRMPVHRRPTDDELAQSEAALPPQPRRVAVVLAGRREPAGWWGDGRAAGWPDAVEAGREVARAAGVELEVRSGRHAPWHPGRCAALLVSGEIVGHAGELHPRVVEALGLPARTSAMELDLDALGAHAGGVVPAPRVSPYPLAREDVALVVGQDVPAAEVESALRAGGGALLESVRLFDVYTGPQVGAGRRSLAYTLRLRAPDRTLTAEEAATARDAVVAEAARRTGAVQRT